MASVACIALNPAVDQTIEVHNLRPGEVNRAQSTQMDVGGKGINVASCLADFRSGIAVTGLLGKENAALFETLFAAKEILNRCVYVEGMTRINTKIVDPAQGMTTDVNTPGPRLTASEIEAQFAHLCKVIDELATTVGWFVLSGSLPPAWPDDTYAKLIRRIRNHGRKVLLDASGPALAAGIVAEPNLLKPNENELGELVGRKLTGLEDIYGAAQELLIAYPRIECIAVSMGGDGALFCGRAETLHAHALEVELLSSVGAGDAMVAGWVAAQIEALPLKESARLATAFSAAKLSRLGPHLPEPGVVRALAGTVQVTSLSTLQLTKSGEREC